MTRTEHVWITYSSKVDADNDTSIGVETSKNVW